MIDFATLQGLTIPEGVVTQIEDASGRVIWAVQSGDKVILEVAKATSGAATSGVLLDIYPKTNGTVKVTYGGITKTVKDTSGYENPNAIQVAFNEADAPSSGELTIEGKFLGFGCGTYTNSKSETMYCACITSVKDFGDVALIPNYAFRRCSSVTNFTIPKSVKEIESNPFADRGIYACDISVEPNNENYAIVNNCLIETKTKRLITGFVNSTIDGVTSIGDCAFLNMSELIGVSFTGNYTVPASVTAIGHKAFHSSNTITLTFLSATPATLGTDAFRIGGINIIVPKGSGETYKTAWSTYANYITEAS